MTDLRYSFFNWTDTSFSGRYGGNDYVFAPLQTREFDPDKHYALILMSKQLADLELLKGIDKVGRNPNDENTFGKSLDKDGKVYVITADMRKVLMRKAIGDLVDVPIPIPQDQSQTDEVGATQRASEDVKTLQEQVAQLTEMVQSMALASKGISSPVVATPEAVGSPVEAEKPKEADMSTTRQVMYEMAVDAGLPVHEGMPKEEIVMLLAKYNQGAQVQAREAEAV